MDVTSRDEETRPEPAGARELARELTALAITRWEEARARLARLESPQGQAADPTNKWGALAANVMLDAERNLILSLLAWKPSFRVWDIHHAMKEHRAPRAVVSSGLLYAAVPDPLHDPRERTTTATTSCESWSSRWPPSCTWPPPTDLPRPCSPDDTMAPGDEPGAIVF